MSLVNAVEGSLYIASQERSLWRLPFPIAANKRVVDCEAYILQCTTAIEIAARTIASSEQTKWCKDLCQLFDEVKEKASEAVLQVAAKWDSFKRTEQKMEAMKHLRGKRLDEEWTDGGTVCSSLLTVRPAMLERLDEAWRLFLEQLFLTPGAEPLPHGVAAAVSTVFFFSRELVTAVEELGWLLRVLYDRASPMASASARITSLNAAL